MKMDAFHGTAPDAPLIGGQDPVSSRTLEVLWVSDSYDLASQFQDGEIRRMSVVLSNPCVMTDDERKAGWPFQGHAAVVDSILADVAAGRADYDGVHFVDTIDGMECGDVVAVFPQRTPSGTWSVDHAVTLTGLRTYDHDIDEWVDGPGFRDADSAQEIATADTDGPGM